jgi:hypothetical protein
VKDQYFADINDYRKYGLLRTLAEAAHLRFGVCWMLTPPDGRTDGGLIGYLADSQRWRRFDPQLFDALRRCHQGAPFRTVKSAERWGLLPEAKYYSAFLMDAAIERHAYFEGAWRALTGCDALFFDPDNGLEVASVPYGRKGSSRYLYWREVTEAFRRQHSVVVYQHFSRQPRQALIAALTRRLQEHTLAPVIYSYSTARVLFLCAPQPAHVLGCAAANVLLADRWGKEVSPAAHTALALPRPG